MESIPEQSARASHRSRRNGLITCILIIAPIAAILAAPTYFVISSLFQVLVGKLDIAQGILTVWDILAMPVLILVVLGTHEIGHLIGGMLRGMRFLMLIVGPFGWHASDAGQGKVTEDQLGMLK